MRESNYHQGEAGNERALSIYITRRHSALGLLMFGLLIAENHATGKRFFSTTVGFFVCFLFSCRYDVDIEQTEGGPWVPQEKA